MRSIPRRSISLLFLAACFAGFGLLGYAGGKASPARVLQEPLARADRMSYGNEVFFTITLQLGATGSFPPSGQMPPVICELVQDDGTKEYWAAQDNLYRRHEIINGVGEYKYATFVLKALGTQSGNITVELDFGGALGKLKTGAIPVDTLDITPACLDNLGSRANHHNSGRPYKGPPGVVLHVCTYAEVLSMAVRFGKNRLVSGIFGVGVAGSMLGYAALMAAPNPLEADQALSRSERMVFYPGKRLVITLSRGADFPERVAQFRRVRCLYTPSTGPAVEWRSVDALYMRHALARHATFGFDAVGSLTGTITITIDDDEIGPISVDPSPSDPCATFGPVGTKPLPRS